MESRVRRIEMEQERSRQNNDQVENVVFAVSLEGDAPRTHCDSDIRVPWTTAFPPPPG